MKVEFHDNDFSTGIILTPETLEEAAELLRFSTNSKREPPIIYLSYSGEISCSVWMEKRKDKISSVNNKI